MLSGNYVNLGLGAIRADLSKDLKLTEEGCPILEPCYEAPNFPLLDFKAALAIDNRDYWIHFFIDDIFFEQLWNPRFTDRDILLLSEFEGCFTPDFTLFPNMSVWQEQFNVFRNRAIGQLVQKKGGRVIPTIGWSNRRSFDFAFKGLSEGGVVAISTNGIKKSLVSIRLFREGVFELERQLRPSIIIIYGDIIEIKTKARQIWHPNSIISRLRKLKQ